MNKKGLLKLTAYCAGGLALGALLFLKIEGPKLDWDLALRRMTR